MYIATYTGLHVGTYGYLLLHWIHMAVRVGMGCLQTLSIFCCKVCIIVIIIIWLQWLHMHAYGCSVVHVTTMNYNYVAITLHGLHVVTLCPCCTEQWYFLLMGSPLHNEWLWYTYRLRHRKESTYILICTHCFLQCTVTTCVIQCIGTALNFCMMVCLTLGP